MSPKTRKPDYISIQDTSASKESDARKRMISPLARRPRRKRRSGNKDSIKENISSSSLRLFSPTSSDQKEDNKHNVGVQGLPSKSSSSIAISKQMPTSISQTLSSSPDGCAPRKTQIRRRIRSQSKLSDLMTSSSNESLLSNK